IRIVVIMPNDPRWRHDAMPIRAFRDDIVCEVEQPSDQNLVTFDCLAFERIARRRRLLYDKAALCSDRHDDHVLDRLRLHEPEDFGTKILLAVGPSDAAARDLAGAHVHPFYPWTVDVDLEEGPRQRQYVDLAAGELYGQIRLRLSGRRHLEVVRAH